MEGNETPEEIAADLAERRAALGRHIAALEARAAPDSILREAGAALGAESGALARRAGREMAANPLATAAVLGGLAWLAVGAFRRPETDGDTPDSPDSAGAAEAAAADDLLRRERERADAQRNPPEDGAA